MKTTETIMCIVCGARVADENDPSGWCQRCRRAFKEGWLQPDLYIKASKLDERKGKL